MTDKLREAAQQALEALETVLTDAYHRRFPECCGRHGSECCGNPNEAWTPEDNKIMDALSPAQRQLSDALRAALAEQPTEREPKNDLMWATVAMQERHDQYIDRIVNALETVKQEQAERYQPVREAFWWRVRIGSGTQTIGRCYTETEAQRLAAELHRAFNDGAFCVEKIVCNGDLIGAATTEAPQPAKRVPLTDDDIDVLWAKQQTKPFKTHAEDRMAFARAIIAAYDAKNGITGETK